MKWIDPPGGKPWALLSVAGASLLLNLVLGVALLTSGGEPETVVVEVPTDAPAAEAVVAATAEAVASAPAPAVLPQGVEILRAPVERSLAWTLGQADSERGDVINAVVARLLWWDLDLRTDLQRGDEVQIAYTWDGELAHVLAATYHSNKLGRTLTAYRFQATGDAYPSWWSEDGTEMALRFLDSPIQDYEQITALVNSRHRHHGVDFKAPVGTPVTAPKAGDVVRTNWNHRFNGNCVEIRYADGMLARFLHLSETLVEPGQRVAAGGVVGRSGNTGHSTAPHLHYELEKSGRVVDPFDYHPTERRTVPTADRAAFADEVARYEALLRVES